MFRWPVFHVLVQCDCEQLPECPSLEVYRQLVNLGCYGADSLKPLFFWSCSSLVGKLWRPRMMHRKEVSKPMVVKFIDKQGRKRCTGLPSALKSSQSAPCLCFACVQSMTRVLRSYTRDFGIKMASVIKDLRQQEHPRLLQQPAVIDANATLLQLLFHQPVSDYWEDVWT